MSWNDAKSFCASKTGYEMFAPRDLNEVAAMKTCLGIDTNFWTEYQYNGIDSVDGSDLDNLGFISETLMMFSSDPMWNRDSATPASTTYDTNKCIHYVNDGDKLYHDACDGGSHEAVCVTKFNLETCENTKVAPSRASAVVVEKNTGMY